ncbi:hypothetical protein ACFPN1_14890 [Lysobacter yangpyeongensis]|uniref:ABC transporter permease n=1 Tax=Lysobacter yangpyeongensis TaxID=346182 RepID=A0ABW0SR18_9GAMM
MIELFKAELLRFRTWCLAAAALHAVVLGFLSRLVDLAQQPMQVYQIFASVYAVAGALLGLYQMGSYRRPNHWLNLLHRPLHRLRIAASLCGAGGVVLLVAIALPIALIALYQEALTARVVDLRHWLMPLASLLIAACGYLAGAYAMLAGRRYAWTVAVLPALLMMARAQGPAALALQATVLLALAGLLAIAFKPDLDAPPRRTAAVIVAALPVQVGLYFLVWMLGFGVEFGWTMAGTHPLDTPVPPAGGAIEANQAEGKDLLLAGIAASRDRDAPLWREQIALSDVTTRWPLRNLPRRNELGNIAPMELDDTGHRVRWVFSHDRMRFIGYSLLDRRARGELGLGTGNAAFPDPTLEYMGGFLLSANGAYQFDAEQQRIFQRIRLPQGEVFADPPDRAGENIVAQSNRALYVYPGREAANTLDRLQPLLRVPLPGPVGNLGRVDLVELLDGYLVSFTYTWGVWSGEFTAPYQQVVHVGADGRVHEVARRALAIDLPEAYTARIWWLSPALRTLCLAAQDLYAGDDPLRVQMPVQWSRSTVLLALTLCALSLLAALALGRRKGLAGAAYWSWVALCGVVGVPALLSLWLMYPWREQVDALPLAPPVAA